MPLQCKARLSDKLLSNNLNIQDNPISIIRALTMEEVKVKQFMVVKETREVMEVRLLRKEDTILREITTVDSRVDTTQAITTTKISINSNNISNLTTITISERE